MPISAESDSIEILVVEPFEHANTLDFRKYMGTFRCCSSKSNILFYPLVLINSVILIKIGRFIAENRRKFNVPNRRIIRSGIVILSGNKMTPKNDDRVVELRLETAWKIRRRS